jgi:hypothetical protein
VFNIRFTVERVSEGEKGEEQVPRGEWGWLPGAGMFGRGKEQGSPSAREPSPDQQLLKDYDQELLQKYDQELSEREARKGGDRGWRWWC